MTGPLSPDDAARIAEALYTEIRRLLHSRRDEPDDVGEYAENVTQQAVASLLADGVIAPGPNL